MKSKESSEIVRKTVTIEGKVQGVGYRAWTRATAAALGLGGFVMNTAEGSVDAEFIGPADQVDTMIARCSEGPVMARVTRVVQKVSEELNLDGGNQVTDFEIRR